jgi:hypothetical protein
LFFFFSFMDHVTLEWILNTPCHLREYLCYFEHIISEYIYIEKEKKLTNKKHPPQTQFFVEFNLILMIDHTKLWFRKISMLDSTRFFSMHVTYGAIFKNKYKKVCRFSFYRATRIKPTIVQQ